MRTGIIVLILLTVVALCGVAVASDTADLARPHLNRISRSVEGLTGWDCQALVIETGNLFIAGVICEK